MWSMTQSVSSRAHALGRDSPALELLLEVFHEAQEEGHEDAGAFGLPRVESVSQSSCHDPAAREGHAAHIAVATRDGSVFDAASTADSSYRAAKYSSSLRWMKA